MRVLHGSWSMGNYTAKDNGFVVWAETSEASETSSSRSARQKIRPHPFAVSIKTLRRALIDLLPSSNNLLRDSVQDANPIVNPTLDGDLTAYLNGLSKAQLSAALCHCP
jgi:hypothetical protein